MILCVGVGFLNPYTIAGVSQQEIAENQVNISDSAYSNVEIGQIITGDNIEDDSNMVVSVQVGIYALDGVDTSILAEYDTPLCTVELFNGTKTTKCEFDGYSMILVFFCEHITTNEKNHGACSKIIEFFTYWKRLIWQLKTHISAQKTLQKCFLKKE